MLSEQYTKYVFVFLTGFVVTYLLTPLVRRFATALGMVDMPIARRIHSTPTPRAGGIAVFLGFHAACCACFLIPWLPFERNLMFSWWFNGFLPASLFVLCFGLVDDFRGLSPRIKLLCQIAAAVIAWAVDIKFSVLLGIPLPGYVDCTLTVIWFLAFMNAFNLIDGLDGLATGLATIASLGVAGSLLLRHMPGDVLMLLGLVGACIAFLRYNFNPASIFLGDSGSLFLGFALAALSLGTGSKGPVLVTIAVPMLAVGVPMFDMFLALWRRSIRSLVSRHKPARDADPAGIFTADKSHLHHRLVETGLSHRGVAYYLYVLSALMIGVALAGMALRSYAMAIYAAAFVAAVYVAVKHLARLELWETAVAIANGLARPPRKSVGVFFYLAADISLLLLASLLANYLAHPVEIDSNLHDWFQYAPLLIGIPFLMLVLAGTYRRVWSQARIWEFAFLLTALVAGIGIAEMFAAASGVHGRRFFAEHFSLYCAFASVALMLIRILPRLAQDILPRLREYYVERAPGQQRTVLYPAGPAAISLIQGHLIQAPQSGNVRRIVGLISDDSNLHGRLIAGYRVLSGLESFDDVISRYRIHEVIITPEASEKSIHQIVESAKRCGISTSKWEARLVTLTEKVNVAR